MSTEQQQITQKSFEVIDSKEEKIIEWLPPEYISMRATVYIEIDNKKKTLVRSSGASLGFNLLQISSWPNQSPSHLVDPALHLDPRLPWLSNSVSMLQNIEWNEGHADCSPKLASRARKSSLT